MEMKKYMTPEMEIVELKLQGILCGSPTTDEGGSTADPGSGSGETPDPGMSF